MSMTREAFDPPAITIFGNCQAEQLARCLRVMVPAATVNFIRYSSDGTDWTRLENAARQIVLVQSPVMSFAEQLDKLRNRHDIIHFPSLAYAGFHPDLIRPKIDGKLVKGPLGSNHSAIVLHAYVTGRDESAAAALFCDEVFSALGYYDYRATSDQQLLRSFDQHGLHIGDEFLESSSRECFMHNTIHPKLSVIAEIARTVLRKVGINSVLSFPENILPDELAGNVVWPVYPEIAARLGLAQGDYVFVHKPIAGHIFTLQQFIAASYVAYVAAGVDASAHPRLASAEFAQLEHMSHRAPVEQLIDNNPYRNLPDHHFWRRAVERVPENEFDPIIKARFTIDANTRVGTAGSCFAQHIAQRLSQSGHNYFVTEPGVGLPPAERTARGFGMFSARYGNIYTVRQLSQLFDRAHGHFTPGESVWRRADGRYIDPFRPLIEPEGFATPADVEAARSEHLAAVRQLFADVDVLVFTMGLTEAWQCRADGAVFPLCPMAVANGLAGDDFEFINFSHDEILEDLRAFLKKLQSVNRSARVLLTVSPVPLIATFEDRHVAVSTAASKAILRSVADHITRSVPNTDYFPSYEIIANPYATTRYYEGDRRTVTSEGVDHVMRTFMRHYSRLPAGQASSAQQDELLSDRQIVCDEERLAS